MPGEQPQRTVLDRVLARRWTPRLLARGRVCRPPAGPRAARPGCDRPAHRLLPRHPSFSPAGRPGAGQCCGRAVDAALAWLLYGRVVGEAGQGVYTAGLGGWWGLARLGNGSGEPLRVQRGGLPQSTVFIDPLTSAGYDQSHWRAGSSDHVEGQCRTGSRWSVGARVEAVGVRQVPAGEEDAGGYPGRGGEDDGESGPDRPQAQSVPGLPLPRTRQAATRVRQDCFGPPAVAAGHSADRGPSPPFLVNGSKGGRAPS